MVSRILSCSITGLEAVPVHVELDLSNGMPGLTIVGMGDTAVRESRERVLAALRNSGYELPPSRVTVNLAPADLKKEGSRYDLPIALGILAALRAFSPSALDGYLVMGELSLTGEVVGREPSFPAALLARKAGIEGIILPKEMAAEAALVKGCRALPVDRLSEVTEFLRGNGTLDPAAPVAVRNPDRIPDLSEVKGQEVPRRVLEIAAAGGHNLLMVGFPGAGKTMLARRLPGILPPLTSEQTVEVTAIHSIAGLLSQGNRIITLPPFRSPHHTISHVGLAGGGTHPRPGEITLSHNGVLFLDEMSEFKRSSLETLRQPLEDGRITITRAARSVSYPARFILVGATNPCPCGFLGHETRPCICSPSAVSRYRRRISGPLMDRIDLVVDVQGVPLERISSHRAGEGSGVVAERVKTVRTAQAERARDGFPTLNSRLSHGDLEKLCPIGREGEALLKEAVRRLGLTARGYHRTLRIARTLADMEGKEVPGPEHLAEAIQYRPVLSGVYG
ncbi:MAG: YifB family Mg chelatase-like AAA ATPase [Deltaproteobacteria bacterium]|nr:YifB family Mg chelatase-like AAA ATPase [Deltaproteobacteria bacterium]